MGVFKAGEASDVRGHYPLLTGFSWRASSSRFGLRPLWPACRIFPIFGSVVSNRQACGPLPERGDVKRGRCSGL